MYFVVMASLVLVLLGMIGAFLISAIRYAFGRPSFLIVYLTAMVISILPVIRHIDYVLIGSFGGSDVFPGYLTIVRPIIRPNLIAFLVVQWLHALLLLVISMRVASFLPWLSAFLPVVLFEIYFYTWSRGNWGTAHTDNVATVWCFIFSIGATALLFGLVLFDRFKRYVVRFVEMIKRVA